MAMHKYTVHRAFFFVVFVATILVAYGLLLSIAIDGEHLFLKTAFSIVLYAFITPFILSRLACRDKLGELSYVIGGILLFHSLFIFIQSFFWYFFELHVDFLEPITGEVQRVFGGYWRDAIWFRPAGLFNEPGTFAAYVSVLLSIYLLSNGKSRRVLLVGGASILLSFSAQGYILFSLLLLLAITKSRLQRVGIFGVAGYWFFSLLTLISTVFILRDRFVDNIDSSYMERVGVLNKFFELVRSGSFLFGHGFSSEPIFGTGSTLIFYLWSYFGVFSLAAFVPLLVFAIRHPMSIIPIFILISTKIVPTAPFFWIAFYSILFLSQQQSSPISASCSKKKFFTVPR